MLHPLQHVAAFDAGNGHRATVVGFHPRLVGANAEAGGVVEVVVEDGGGGFEFRVIGNLNDHVLVDDGLFMEVPHPDAERDRHADVEAEVARGFAGCRFVGPAADHHDVEE